MPYTPGKFSRLAFEPQKIRPKKQIEIPKIIGKTFHRPVTSGPPIAVQFSRVDLMGIVLGQPWSRSISAKQCALIRMISKTSWGKKIASPPGDSKIIHGIPSNKFLGKTKSTCCYALVGTTTTSPFLVGCRIYQLVQPRNIRTILRIRKKKHSGCVELGVFGDFSVYHRFDE